MAQDLEERLRRLEEDERGRWSSWRTKLIALVLLAGLGVAIYFLNKQDKKNIAENGVLLPPVLIHKASAARRDLALLNRDLSELAKEIDKKLSGHPGEDNRKKGDRYIARIQGLRKLGSTLEPRLTREERRVLMATEHAEKLLEQFIRSTYGQAFYDHALIEKARKQIDRAQALARGENADAIINEGRPGGVLSQVASIAGGLKQIKELKDARQPVPSNVAYVPEIDGPRHSDGEHHQKTKKKSKTKKKKSKKRQPKD